MLVRTLKSLSDNAGTEVPNTLVVLADSPPAVFSVSSSSSDVWAACTIDCTCFLRVGFDRVSTPIGSAKRIRRFASSLSFERPAEES